MIRAAIGRPEVHHANQDLGAITLSFGVAIFPDNAGDTGSLVKAADVALYQAKHQGRNCLVVSQERAEPLFGDNERGTLERDSRPVVTPGQLQ